MALKADIKRLQSREWVGEADRREFSEDLINILHAGPVHERRLLESMHIDKADIDAVRALSKQLEMMERFGLVRLTKSGWQWIS